MRPIDRVMAALSHREADRVPVFLLFTMHGARELGLSIQDYYARADRVVEGQLRLRRRFGHDCYYAFTYAAAEHQAFGGEVLFSSDGPPNAGAPVVRHRDDIFRLEVPDIASCAPLLTGIEVTRGLSAASQGEVPVVAAVISPFSLPIMLMGFAPYLDLLHDDREAFDRLMGVTRPFCTALANAHFAAGATAVAYFDPLASSAILEEGLYRRLGHPVAVEALGTFRGASALHLGSARARGRLDLYATTGAAALGVGCLDDLAEVKREAAGRLALIGGLNGVAMASATPEAAAQHARECIVAAARGGGFILADGHGEIPFQVSDEVLHAVMETARVAGAYRPPAGDP